LIVTTLAVAVAVEWYGNHDVGLELFSFARYDFGKLCGEPIAEAGNLFILQ
jgi:hypothetical protein